MIRPIREATAASSSNREREVVAAPGMWFFIGELVNERKREGYVGELIKVWRQNGNSKGGQEEDEDKHVTPHSRVQPRLYHIHS